MCSCLNEDPCQIQATGSPWDVVEPGGVLAAKLLTLMAAGMAIQMSPHLLLTFQYYADLFKCTLIFVFL